MTEIAVVEREGDWRNEMAIEAAAKEVAEALSVAYPDHFWAIGYQGGAIVVKNMAIIDGGNQYGMVLPKHYSSSDLKRNAILMAGELLERAGMKRGAWNGEVSMKMDKS